MNVCLTHMKSAMKKKKKKIHRFLTEQQREYYLALTEKREHSKQQLSVPSPPVLLYRKLCLILGWEWAGREKEGTYLFCPIVSKSFTIIVREDELSRAIPFKSNSTIWKKKRKKKDQIQIIKTSYAKINSRVAYTTKLSRNKFCI